MNALSIFSPSLSNDLFDAVDRSFLDFFPAMTESKGTSRFLMPKADILETENNYQIEMDLPGLTDKDVEISLKDKLLTISSKKEEKKEEKKEGSWLIKERRSYNFSRRFTLPEDSDSENVKASFKNGVLSIEIPRRPEAQTRTIAISA